MSDKSRQMYKCSVTGRSYSVSFTTRHLMQSLREAICAAIEDGNYDTQDNRLSRVRGQLVEHISRLEQKPIQPIADVKTVPGFILEYEFNERRKAGWRMREAAGWRVMMGVPCPPAWDNTKGN